MTFLTVVALCAAAFFLLPILSDLMALIEVATGHGRRQVRTSGTGARILYLVPTQDEDTLVEACIRSVRRQLYPHDHIAIVVIADNCSDNTATRARAAGAECLERYDPQHPGRSAALAWAFRRLNITRFDAVVILDADSIVDPRHAAALDRKGALRRKVFESFHDVRNRHDSSITRMSSVFATARYRSAYRLKQLAGLNVPLSNGLCIGTDILRTFPWRATGPSADCEVYARLTSLGVPIDLAADAHVYAQETRTLKEATSPRAHWPGRRLEVLSRIGNVVLRSRAIGWHQKLDTLTELAVPGPAFHAGICGALAFAVLFTGAPFAGPVATLLLLTLVRPVAYTLIGVKLDPEPGRALASFAFLPVYSVCRCMVALRNAMLTWPGTLSRPVRTHQPHAGVKV